MFSSRIFSFFLLFVSFGMFACAKPIAVAENSSDLVARSSTEDLVLVALVDLKAKIDLLVPGLDGHNTAPWNDVIAALNANIDLLVLIDAESGHGPHYDEISVKISVILQVLATAAGKYSLLAWLLIKVQLSITINLWLGHLGGLIPGLLTTVLALVGGLLGTVVGLLGLIL